MARTLFNILLLLFAFLLIQDNLPFIKSGALNGAFTPKENISFDWKKWFTGEYQQKKDAYINENFPFRADAIRLDNQLNYSLFNKINTSSLAIGKDYYLYEKPYIDSYLGLDFTSQQQNNEVVRSIKTLQDNLSQEGKLLITIIAPGKGHFYPDKFPDTYPSTPKDSTNYKSFLSATKEYQGKECLNLIVFNDWLLKVRDTSRYCIYPKTGIHWSMYGAALATDSLVNYIETLTKEDIPDMVWESIEVTKECRETDCDIEKTLNLIWQLPNGYFAYPKIKFDKEGKKEFKALIISDSFYFSMYHYAVNWGLFGHNTEFWFYNNSIFPGRDGNPTAKDLNLEEELEKVDIIILMHRESGIQHIGSGFIESANAIYTKQK